VSIPARTPEPELSAAPEQAPALASTGTSPAPSTRRHGRTRRITLAVAVVALLGVAASTVLLVLDALAVRSALTAAADRVPTLQDALAGDADPAALAAGLAALQDDTAAAREHTDGPVWAAATRLPQLGPHLAAVQRIAVGLDDVASDVAPALLATRDAIAGTHRTADGGIDLTALQALAPRLAAAEAAVTATSADLATVDPADLLPEVADPLVQLRSRLEGLAEAVGTADRAAALVPPMLGADGPRTYLVLALTNAELRSGGGLPGSVLLVRADAGHVEVLRQVPGVDIGPFLTPVAALDPETAEIFTERPAVFVQDVTLTPEFPTSAALAAQMWAQHEGEQVDGVIATDPVAFAQLLGAAGPVEVGAPSGTGTVAVGADNAVALLEHEVYSALDDGTGAASDAFFGRVVAASIGRFMSPDVDQAAVLAALADAASRHRIHVWSAHPDEQARLAGTVLGGAFLSDPRSADAVGVFFDDSVAGKMSWFLQTSVRLVASECTSGGRLDTLEVTMASTAPADAATSLPSYVAGWPTPTHTPGTLSTVLRVAGPVGSPAPRVRRDGVPLGMDTHTLAGRSMGSGTITLAPGESTTVRIEALATAAGSTGGGAAPAGTLDIWSTPTAHADGLQTVPVPVCAPIG
jgi:hypothetical protein